MRQPRGPWEPQYLGGQTVWKHVGVSTGESSWSLQGPVVREGAEALGRVAQGSHTLGKAAQQRFPARASSSVHVLLAEVREFCDASLRAALCLRAAL